MGKSKREGKWRAGQIKQAFPKRQKRQNMRKGKSLTVRCRESDGNEISHRGRERPDHNYCGDTH